MFVCNKGVLGGVGVSTNPRGSPQGVSGDVGWSGVGTEGGDKFKDGSTGGKPSVEWQLSPLFHRLTRLQPRKGEGQKKRSATAPARFPLLFGCLELTPLESQ